jgi:hypothetical protein
MAFSIPLEEMHGHWEAFPYAQLKFIKDEGMEIQVR